AAVGASLTGDAVAHKDLDATGVPVLVITSTDDVQFPPQLVIDSAQRLANASIVEVAGAGPLDVLRAARPLQRRVDRVHRESGTMRKESEAVPLTGNTPR